MNVGILGLGLIGGSFAKAFHADGHTVLARDTDLSTLSFAILEGTVSGELTPANAAACDLVLLCTPPAAAIDWLKTAAPSLGTRPHVMDSCGTKREIVSAALPLAAAHGFTFVGGHPMAGTQYSGYKHSRPDLFRGAPLVLVPPVFDDISLLARVKTLLAPAGFGRLAVTTADAHDAVIAFTSQLPHILSNAYVKSPAAASHHGFSAGSYRDLTRVARLNPALWAELCLDNRDHLLPELDLLIANLSAYRDALSASDRPLLESLLRDGSDRKNSLDP